MNPSNENNRNNDNGGGNSISNVSENKNSDDSFSAIGASLLPLLPSNDNRARKYDIIGNAKGSHKRNRTASNRHRENSDCYQGSASLLLHGGISSFSTNRRTSRNRILLRGPPRSGKTSLAMNLAYTEAKKDQGLPSGCVSAIVYRSLGRRNSNNNHQTDVRESSITSESDQFPLFCRVLRPQTARSNEVNIHDSESNTSEGLNATALDNEEMATKKQERDCWDPDTLSRIRICRVSSVRELWEGMFVLAGKPVDEQPTRAIIIEDLDQIIESGGESSKRNHVSGVGRKNTKHNHISAMMLKTVAIAADTALAMGNNQNEHSPSSHHLNSLRLLVTLTTTDARQHQRDSSDVLAVASCIDTVVALYERPQDTDDQTDMDKEDGDFVKVAKSSTNRDEDTINQNSNSNSSNGKEIIVVNSIWQAEIQERRLDQYCRQSGNDFNGDTIGVSMVIDYAFVDSFVKEEDNIGFGECEDSKELRWRHSSIAS